MYEAQDSALFLLHVYLLIANLILFGCNLYRGNLAIALVNLAIVFFPIFSIGIMTGIIGR